MLLVNFWDLFGNFVRVCFGGENFVFDNLGSVFWVIGLSFRFAMFFF